MRNSHGPAAVGLCADGGGPHTGNIVSTGSQCATPTSPLFNLPNKLFFKIKKKLQPTTSIALSSPLSCSVLSQPTRFLPHTAVQVARGDCQKTPSNLFRLHPIPPSSQASFPPPPLNLPLQTSPAAKKKKDKKPHPPLRTSYAHTIPQTHPNPDFHPPVLKVSSAVLSSVEVGGGGGGEREEEGCRGRGRGRGRGRDGRER